MISLRAPLGILGSAICLLGLLMLIPLLVDFSNNEATWVCFFYGLVSTIFVGGFLIAATKEKKYHQSHPKERILAVVLFWLIVPFFASLPYLYSSLPFNVFDYYFEAVSSMSTTGSTIIYDFNGVSHGIIIWRAVLQLLGACVFIISYCLIFQSVHVGYNNNPTLISMQKNFDEKYILDKSIILISGIVLISLLGALSIAVSSDTNFFISFFVSSSLISTTGIPYTRLPIEHNTIMLYTCVILMFISGMPLLSIFDRKWKQIINDMQLRVYFFLTLIFSLILLIFQSFDYLSMESITETLFETISSITTNSVYFDREYSMTAISFFLKFIGGCTGCASGGVKILRIMIMASILKNAIAKIANTGTQYIVSKNPFIIDSKVVILTMSYIIVFIISVAVLGMSLVFTGLTFSNSLNFVYTAITNNIISSWNSPLSIVDIMAMSNAAKVILCLAMIMGRLDILTAFVIFSKRFWRR